MKILTQKNTCTSVFIAALFIIATTWKQHNLSTDKLIKKLYAFTMEYYLEVKKNEIIPFVATWKDLEIIILSEMSDKCQTKKNIILYHLYVESKKWYRGTYKTEIESQM